MGREDNPEFEYALATSAVDADFIYFDEEEDDEEESHLANSLQNTRLVVATLLEASGGDRLKLQAIFATFAGYPLRAVGKLCGRSHEWVRLQIDSLQDDYPALHGVLVDGWNNYEVRALSPNVSSKYTVENLESGRKHHTNNLLEWFKDRRLPWNDNYYPRQSRHGRSRTIEAKGKRYKITRNEHGARIQLHGTTGTGCD